MRIVQAVLVFVLILMATGCNAEITGTVVDAETGEPIEGAVVLVEWTMTKGLPGMTYRERYMVTESVTDSYGRVSIREIHNPLVGAPVIVIYKKGYVAWRSDFIFPNYVRRKNFKWVQGYVFRLEHFLRGFLHSKHVLFIRSGLSLDSSSKLEQAYSWEWGLASKEEELYRKRIKTIKPGETEEGVWNQIRQELYNQKSGEPK